MQALQRPPETKQVIATGHREECFSCSGTGAMWPEGWARPLRHGGAQVDCLVCRGKGSVLTFSLWEPR